MVYLARNFCEIKIREMFTIIEFAYFAPTTKVIIDRQVVTARLIRAGKRSKGMKRDINEAVHRIKLGK